jgi:Protein of unknown function (DUF1552)
MSPKNGISRRTILRSTGAVLALPWLETLISASTKATVKPPIRLGFFYIPNGVNLDDWRLKTSGTLSELSTTLKPLEPIKDQITVLTGLAAMHNKGNSASHEPAGGGLLVGHKCKHSEEPEVGGPSIDQVIAKEIGQQTAVDSLALGIDPGIRGDHGYSGTYMSHISWRNKTTPVALEINPKQLYERLFRGKPPRKADWSKNELESTEKQAVTPETSVLDLVRDQTKALQRKLNYADRQKMEQYLEGLRSVERRIDLANQDAHSHHQDDLSKVSANEPHEPELAQIIIPKGNGIPSEYAEHVNLMLDILTLAYQTDTTRVASFMFSFEKSTRAYPQIDAPGSHHSTSHHKKEKKNLDQLTKINTHHMELFSRMLQRMSKIPEGEGTLLDNVMFLYGGGISDGNKHNNNDLPMLMAGGGGGTLTGGRHLVYPDYTPVCNVYIEMANRMGVKLDRFGDSNSPLSNLRG